MITKQFKERSRAEWKRLNPSYVNPSQPVSQTVLSACMETVPGYFAPLRFIWWLVVRSWRSAKTTRGDLK